MSPRAYDRYMLQVGAGKHVKFRRLTDRERYAFFLGLLSLAARSPVRGCLMIGNLAVEPADVATECDVAEKVAESAMQKLRSLGVLERDENGFEWVHDFEDFNPAPKQDRTAAERQKRKRDRQRQSRRDVTAVTDRDAADVTERHAPEVEEEVEEKEEANASSSAVADAESREDVARLCHLLANLIVGNDRKARVSPESKGWQDAARLLLDRDGRTEADVATVIRWCQADAFWRANVLSMPKLREKYAQLLLKMQGDRPQLAAVPPEFSKYDRAAGASR